MGQAITMEAVAELSGVSVSTVSLVLRDKPGINAETRKRVLMAARTLGYQRKYASDLQRRESLLHFGLVMKTPTREIPRGNQFYSHVIAGVEAACRKLQINLLYATIPVDDAFHSLELPRLFFDPHVNGVLLVGSFLDEIISDAIQGQALPVVLVDSYAPAPAYDAVVGDNEQGAYEAVSYLIRQGHRQIGLVGTLPNTFPSIDERRVGFLRALSDHGIAESYFGDSYWQIDEVYTATLTLLRRHPQITALFAGNDESAIGAMRAAEMLGRSVPDDLSVVGFDDIDLARQAVPALTTMQVDKVMMGRLAVQLLANRVEFPGSATATTIIRPRLVERQSVAAPVLSPSGAKPRREVLLGYTPAT